MELIGRFQNKFTRSIIKAVFYIITNEQLRSDLGPDNISVTICEKTIRYIQRLQNHLNVEAVILLHDSNDTQRLSR